MTVDVLASGVRQPLDTIQTRARRRADWPKETNSLYAASVRRLAAATVMAASRRRAAVGRRSHKQLRTPRERHRVRASTGDGRVGRHPILAPAPPGTTVERTQPAVPESLPYTHAEGNSPAHVKASLLGSSVQVIVKHGKLRLGTWQGIFLGVFDGPRIRKVWINLSGSA